MRYLIGLILLVLIALGAAYVAAGRGGPPSITIAKPEKWVGASTPMEVDIGAPGAQLKTLSIVFEQNGKQTTLYSMENGQPSGEGVKLDGPDKLVISRTLGKETVPGLQTGPGRITATASRTALHGLRTLQSSASHDGKSWPRLTSHRIGLKCALPFAVAMSAPLGTIGCAASEIRSAATKKRCSLASR